jgi:hypothetical protein
MILTLAGKSKKFKIQVGIILWYNSFPECLRKKKRIVKKEEENPPNCKEGKM